MSEKYAQRSFELKEVATVYNNRLLPEDDNWDNVISEIRLVDSLDESAIQAINTFSHIEVLYLFHLVDPQNIRPELARPRGNSDWPEVGIFAQRKKNRPNRLGSTICEIVRKEGRSIFVKGLDAINETPVLDIKPFLKEFLPRTQIFQANWSTELMKNYW